MFCTNCGKQIPDDSKFCVHCGAQLGASNAHPNAGGNNRNAVPFQSTSNGAPKKSGNSKLPLIIGGAAAAVLILVIAVVGILFLTRGNSSSSAAVPGAAAYPPAAESGLSGNNAASGSIVQDSDSQNTQNDAYESGSDTQGAGMADLVRLSDSTTEGRLQSRIIEMNDGMHSLPSIDIYADNYQAGARNTAYKWDDKVFYTLEGFIESAGYMNKNLYQLVKKELINAVTGNLIDYEIYINPYTGVANKIVSIEYQSEGIEVTEYYFDNDIKVSFMFQYQTDNYVSTYATPDKAGQRFLFCNDTLVTWRVINDNKINYTIGSNEAERLKGSWAANTIAPYTSLDAGSRQSYDNAEQMMIDAAYNTYYTVMNAEGIARVTGAVYDGSNNGYGNADVELYSSDFNQMIFKTQTDANGNYVIYVPNEEYTYNIRVIAPGKRECRVYRVGMDNGQIGAYQDGVFLFDEGNGNAGLSMTLGDAFTYNPSGTGMMLLNYAQVNVREGVNNRYGSIVYQGSTNADGYIYLELTPGVYTIEVIANGYETMYYTVVVSPYKDNVYEFYAAPTLSSGEYAIVLTWGAYPEDLDSHLFTTKGSQTNHIWYGSKNDQFGNYLDVDDTTSYGPETVTIRNFSSTDYYKYAVVDFTNCSGNRVGSYDMSYSGATVNVYSSDGLIGTFHVPNNMPGVIWEIFEIRNGVLTPIQRYYNNVVDKDWWHSDK